jgi:hypothetical protein
MICRARVNECARTWKWCVRDARTVVSGAMMIKWLVGEMQDCCVCTEYARKPMAVC